MFMQPLLIQPILMQPLLMQPLLAKPFLVQPCLSQPCLIHYLLIQPLLTQPLPKQPLLLQPFLTQPLRIQPCVVQLFFSHNPSSFFLCILSSHYSSRTISSNATSSQTHVFESTNFLMNSVLVQWFLTMLFCSSDNF